ncbi:MAG: oxidoreductase [Gammaproteobacteria bacterium]|nr:oxidoreductase [Gammaproteobacteria bacterium]
MNLIAAQILLPLAGALIAFLWPRHARITGIIVAFTLVLLALSLAFAVNADGVLRTSLGGWDPPLGISLYADGLTTLFLCLTAVVGLGASLHATGYFKSGRSESDLNSIAHGWWPLWLALWAALNALFLTEDVFNLYVTLELMGLAAVALVSLEAHAVTAATRYLLVGLLGSMFYLLGVGLLYALHGTVDIRALSALLQPEPAAWVAMALMTAGLLLKAALFPLHFWLPPAHANAPAPVSAVLSALVVKAAFYVLFRLWLGPFAPIATDLAGQLLGILGAGAIIWGSLQAFMAPRLKLVVAYSTVAQIGYLFLWFPFAGSSVAGAIAWYGVVWLALSHGLAKAGLFLAAGNILHASGHDRVTDLAGVGQHMPVTLFAVGIACASIMGLPPSGGFVGKWLLLNAAFVSGQWWWAAVLLFGGVMAAAYSFRVLLHAFRNKASTVPAHTPHPLMQWSALALAVGALLLGILSAMPLQLAEIGASVGKLELTEAP